MEVSRAIDLIDDKMCCGQWAMSNNDTFKPHILLAMSISGFNTHAVAKEISLNAD